MINAGQELRSSGLLCSE